MIEVARLKPEDIFNIEKRPQTKGLAENLTLEDAERIASLPWSYSVFEASGRLIAIGGVMPRWKNRGETWAVFAPGSKQYLPEITKVVLSILDDAPMHRLEFAVRCDFPQGHAWAKDLGFHMEAECLEAYDIEGHDCSIYARIKGKQISPEQVRGVNGEK